MGKRIISRKRRNELTHNLWLAGYTEAMIISLLDKRYTLFDVDRDTIRNVHRNLCHKMNHFLDNNILNEEK